MALYKDLVANAQAAASDTLRQQIKMAIAASAFTITNEAATVPNHVIRLAWAKAALGNLDSEVDRVLWYVLAANASASINAINGASDATVQSNVDAAVNLFAS
jgi:hypothetical protein